MNSSSTRKKNKERELRAVSLFSGGGGMDIGVRQAGFNVLCQVEIDPHCCETLRQAAIREKQQTIVVENDVRKVDENELLERMGLVAGELDLLFGGPPCQAFSLIGKRASLDDERGMLLFEIVRFAKAFRPRAVMIEQVKGLLSAPDANGVKGGAFRDLLTQLESLDYVPKWKVALAADYGVPQLRERVIIVATKKPNGFQFPAPTHSDNKTSSGSLFALPQYRTVGEALEGLEKPIVGRDIPSKNNHVDITPDGDRRRIAGVPEGSHLAKELHLPTSQRQNLSKKDTTKFRRLSRKEPSLTLRCGEIFFHPTEDRYLTPREYMRIHGYPDDYILMGPVRGRSGSVKNLDQHRQIANSVPPPLARSIAREIRKVIECQKSSRYSDTQSQIKPKKQKKVGGTRTVRS